MYKNDLKYHVDIVLVIDCTESMDHVLNMVKSHALSFYGDLQSYMKNQNKNVDRIRVRVVGFRDYAAYDEERQRKTHCNEPMLVSDFFELPEEAEKFEASVLSLQPYGGGDDREDGLEALAYAIRSDWDKTDEAKKRHVIVVWSDQPPHEIGTHAAASKYPKGMAKSFNELSAWWGDKKAPGLMDWEAKRLVLYAPEEGAWKTIFDNWDLAVFFPSKAGDHLENVQYEEILDTLSHTV